MEGGCTCRAVRYRLTGKPLFVHCCHCRWCQRETGSAFALNAMIEADRVVVLQRRARDRARRRRNSGKGQKIARCPTCRIAVWSNYAGAGDAVRFVRVGHARRARSAAARHPHLHDVEAAVGRAAEGAPAVAEYYECKEYWPAESLARWSALKGR